MGIFDFVQNSPKDEFGAHEIISHTGGDPVLVARFLRFLTATGIFNVTSGGTYKADPVVKELAKGGDLESRILMNLASFENSHPAKSLLILISDIHAQIYAKLPQYLRETQYASPSNAQAGPFQYALGTDEHYFDWMKSHPIQLNAFNRTMQAGVVRDNTARWTAIFPVEQQFQRFQMQNIPIDKSFEFVDIGGGIGHEIKVLLDSMPSLQGQFTLQDLPGVVESMLPELKTNNITQNVQGMPYSFFEPQPVKGAHVYFLGRVLHDWPDVQARSILGHIRKAMHEDSILLIHERVLPDIPTRVHLSDAIMDLNMMILCSSLERTEMQFDTLLKSVGLKLVKTWRPKNAGLQQQAVLEVVREGFP
ncbi:hypothetical protein N7454_004409 [Penicillium verhagenii]|nr:hypothetical protein N7454_004409 [Penicillium verhagenii]